MQIFTTKGILDTDQLDVKDIISYEGCARVTVTQWRLKGEDEIVRQDVNANVLVGQDITGEQGVI